MNKAKVLAALLLTTGAISITACNTIQGVGEDVQAAGAAVEDTSEEVEEDLTDGDPATP